MTSGYAGLDPCVHCGFCLPACPTYLATGDENDSPRGRIVLMRALERGELPPSDPALERHLGACLGCRGCEPVCPSGVEYGRGLETARAALAAAGGLPTAVRAVLAVFGHRAVWRLLFGAARLLRQTGLPARLAGPGRLGFTWGMLAASGPAAPPQRGGRPVEPRPAAPRVALFRGCVMDRLFDHVHEATRRTLEYNGYRVIEPPGQVCCGALHAHAGDVSSARRLAGINAAALSAADIVVVNSAGCGAMLRDYGHLLGHAAGERVAARVRDVSQLLAERGPKPGGALPLDVLYDAPCHLQHAQRVHAEPLAVLGAVPGLRLRPHRAADQCCGSAGIFSLTQPGMARRVLADKVAAIAAASPRPALVLTGNPGCLMQIGAGLRAARLPIGVAHPVELLDRSYRAAGYYAGTER